MQLVALMDNLIDKKWFIFYLKDTKMSVDNIFMMRKGELKQAINTTLDVCDKFFDDLETEDKVKKLIAFLI